MTSKLYVNESLLRSSVYYPFVPINKALNVLIDQLNNKDDLMKRTKLCLKDIYELAEHCLSKCYYGTMKLEY